MLTRTATYCLISSLIMALGGGAFAQCVPCDATVTTVNVDLSAKTDTTALINDTLRNDYCCGASGATRCIRFNITLNPKSEQLAFDVQNPGPPGGAFYQIDCGTTYSLADSLCVTGQTSLCLTFCKSGGDKPDYIITVGRNSGTGPDITLNAGCSDTLTVSGLQESGITWTSVAPGARGTYDGYLSCTSACDTVIVTAPIPLPGISYVDYEVSGTASGCAAGTSTDTIRVYFVASTLTVAIAPPDPAICFGGTGVGLTATPSGGAPPYTLTWSTGATTATIVANTTGTYWVEVADTTNCLPATDTVVVTQFILPIEANAGNDTTVCAASPFVSLNGSVQEAAGGTWFGGGGVFTPDPDTLDATYTPTAPEIAAGTVTLYLETTGNGGCPSDTDTVVVTIQPTEAPAFTYGSASYCQGDADPTPVITGTPGGTFTEGTGNIVFISAATGQIDLSASTAGGPYTIKYVTPGLCPDSTTFSVTIVAEDDPAFTYGAASYCQGDADPTPAITGTPGGTFTESTGNIVFVSAATGQIDLSASTAGGPYTVTYTTPGACPNSATFSVSIIAEDDPAFTYGSASYCQGDANPTPVVTGTPGGTFTEVTGNIVFVSAATGQINLSASTAGGPYTITYTTPGACPNSATFSVSIVAEDDPAFTYGAAGYCQGDADPTPVVTGTPGGTFTEGTGNVVFISAATGQIDLSASTAGGPYTVTYTTPGACPNSATFSITITAEGDPAFTYGSASYCQGDANPTPVITGTPGGTFTEGTGNIIFVSAATGQINLAASAAGGPYTITYTTPGACSNSTTFDVTIVAEDDPAFTYGAAGYCPTDADPTPVVTGTPGGTFTEGTGNIVFISAATGQIDLSASTVGGPYTVTYTTPGTCPNSATFSVTILAEDDPAFTYGAASYCQGDANPTPVITGTPGGTFTEGTGNIVFVSAATGQINLAASAAGGPYTITYTTPGACPNSTTFDVTIIAEDDPAFTYGAASYCPGDADPTPVVTGTPGGTFTEGTGNIVFISAATGQVDLSASTVGGPYTITYTTPGACPNSATFSLTIVAVDDPAFTYGSASYCQGDANPTPVITGTPGGTFSESSGNIVFVSAATGQINLAASAAGGPYTVKYVTPGFCPDSATFSVSIVAEDDPSFTYSSGTYCQSGADPTPVITGTPGGTFSEASGNIVFISTATGEIDLSASTLGGPYSVVYTTAGACPNSLTIGIRITSSLDAEFTYAGTPFCEQGANPSPTHTTGSPGTFSSSPAGVVFVNVNTGVINLTTSTPGAYRIYNNIPASGGCTAAVDSFDIVINPRDDPSFTYGAASYCQGDADPTPVITGAPGGTFSEGTGNISFISAATGQIDLSASTAGGPYTITYTTAGVCPSSTTFSVTVLAEEDPSFTYGSASYCQGDADPTPVVSGTPGGTFTEGTGNIVFVSAATGQIDLSASTVGGPYTVTYTTPGVCSNSTTFAVTIVAEDDPAFTYGAAGYCQSDANPTPVVTGTPGGTFTEGTGNIVFVSAATGEINLAASTAGGPYTITYTTPGACPNSATFSVTILAEDDPAFTYGSASYCQGDADPTPVITGTPGGSFTEGTGNVVFISPATGQIDLSASTAGGPYIITYTTPGACPNSTTFSVTIITEDDPAFTYGAATYCITGSDPTPVVTGTPGGTFTEGTGNIVFISPATGQIDVSASTVGGPYTITYTTPGACPNSATLAVNITLAPDATFSYSDPFCVGEANPLPSFPPGAGAGTFSASPGGLVFANPSTGAINLAASTAGTYTVKNLIAAAAGCAADSFSVSITVNPAVIVSAGADLTVCADTGTVQLSGSVLNAGGGIWTHNGTAMLSPSNTVMTPTYTLTPADTAAGSVRFILTSTGNGACSAKKDTVFMTITPAPFVNAGNDLVICAHQPSAALSGLVGGATSTGVWTTTGSGTFSDSSILGALYFPSAADTAAGSVRLVLTSTGNGSCRAVSDTLQLSINPGIYVAAGSDVTVCANNAAVSLGGSVASASGTGRWSTGGSGSFTPHDSLMTAVYAPGAADTSAGSVWLYLTSTNNGGCAAETDSLEITITPAPVAAAGTDQSVCSNNAAVTLSGSVSGGATKGRWTTDGTGSFAPNDSALGATYTPSAGDTAAGTVTFILTTTDTGTCLAVRDTMVLTIFPFPSVSAGSDRFICNDDSAALGGISGSGSGRWSTTGDGSFVPDDSTLAVTYVPGSADTIAGSVQLVLTTTNNGSCLAVTDTMTLTFTPRPVVTITAIDSSVCSEGAGIAISGTVTGSSTTGIWTTSGSGSFSPSDTSLNATYMPSAADIAAGSVVLTLSSTNACLAQDARTATILPAPLATAGSDIYVCIGDTSAALDGSVSGLTTTGRWTTLGSGSFLPNDSTLKGDYRFSPADSTAGSVTLLLTSTNNGVCAADTDTVVITMTTIPVVSAGADDTVCANVTAGLNGTVSGGSSTGIWTTLGSGAFGNDTMLSTTYTPGNADTAAGSVRLVLSSTKACLTVTDTVTIEIGPSPVVNAGGDITVCTSNPDVNLSGSVSVVTTTGRWTTNGAGTFTPNDSDLAATYIPAPSDTAAGTIDIILISTNNQDCNPVSDTLTVTILPSPLVYAGADRYVCIGDTSVALSGAVGGSATTARWTTTGSGAFLPSDSTLNAAYRISPADSAAGAFRLILTTTNNGSCTAVADTMTVTLTDAPVVNAGFDRTACANTSVVLIGSVTGGSTSGIWTTTGSGTFSNDTSMNAIYTFSAADTAAGSVAIVLTSTKACVDISDTMVITVTPAPAVNAGPDQALCANNAAVSLNGSVSVATTTGKWKTLGSGTFSPADTALGGTYTPSAADIAAGTVRLVLTSTNNMTCKAVRDTLRVTFTPAPAVSAGSDIYVCLGNNAALSGSVTLGASTGRWTTTGTGTFTPNDSALNATYVPGAADTAAGSVTLILTSANNGNCLPVTDTVRIFFTDPPSVQAGGDATVCANNAAVSLSGSVSGASTTGRWTTDGGGTFVPSDTALNATYIPDTADTAAGTVRIYLTSTYACPVTDTLTVTITPAPWVNAGPDPFVCVTNPAVSLNGIIGGGATTGRWTTLGSGTFSPADTALTGNYNPSPADTLTGTVVLILTSTNNGNCLPVRDTILVSIVPPPIVDAGPDDTVCANNYVYLNGSVVAGASTGIWRTAGTGRFVPNATALNGVYLFSDADTALGQLQFVLEPTNFSGCPVDYDTMTVTITPAPYLNAGSDRTVCANNSAVSLNGQVGGPTSTGVWSTLGSGTFSPSDTSLATTYLPGAPDTAAGLVYLVLTTTGNGKCLAETDTVAVTITPSPAVYAGPDFLACKEDNVLLSGAVSGGATTGRWTTTGDGSFTPNDTALNASYVPGSADTATGSVTLILTSTNNGNCLPVTDTAVISFVNKPLVLAGADLSVCANNAAVSLNGSVSGSTTTGTWTSSGTGAFSPSDTALNATYLPDSADTAAGSVTLILRSTNSCVTSDTLVVTITPAPVVNAGGDRIICIGDTSVALNGNVYGGAVTGRWTTSGTGSFLPNDSALIAAYRLSAADAAAGAFTLVLQSTNYGNCLPVSDTVRVSMTSVPVSNAGADDTVCANVNVVLNGNVTGGASTGIWTTSGSGTFAPDTALNTTYIFSNADTAAGIVQLILTATNACVPASDTLTVIITPAPAPRITLADSLACGNNIVIDLDATIFHAAGGRWTSSGTGSFSPLDTGFPVTYTAGPADTAAGYVTIYLTTTGNGDCNATTDSVTVGFTPAPVVSAGPDRNVCFDVKDVDLSGLVSGGSTTGRWRTTGTGMFSPNDSDLAAIYIPGIADTSSASVTIILTSTNNGGCFAVSDTMRIVWSDRPSVNAGSVPAICSSTDTVQLNGLVTGGTTTGIWTTSGSGVFVPSDTALNAVYIPGAADDSAGTVVLTLTATNGCSPEQDSLVLRIHPTPTAAFSTATACDTLGASFTDLSSIFGSAGITGRSWDFGDGSTDTVKNPAHTYDSAGTYTVTLTVTSDSGCPATTTQAVDIHTLFAQFGFETACLEDGVRFTDSTAVANDSIIALLWDFGDGSSDSVPNPMHFYGTDTTYTVTLTVWTAKGCTDTVTRSVTVYPNPVAGFETDNADPSVLETFGLIDRSSGAATWYWTFGDGSSSTAQNPRHTYGSTGSYVITLVVANAYGCTDTASMTIAIEGIFPPAVPTGFTPNGDGQNDFLWVEGGPFRKLRFRVYNEWGLLVFESNDQQTGWDGRKNGKDQPVGVYLYIVDAETIDGQVFEHISGDVLLLR